jgi:hypothetical protein
VVTIGTAMKVAVTVVPPWPTSTSHSFALIGVQLALQLTKTEPAAAGVYFRVVVSPSTNTAEQVAPQLIPAGVLSIVPSAVPPLITFKETAPGGLKVADTPDAWAI